VQNAAQAGVDWAMANHIFNNVAIRAAATNATDYADITVSAATVQCGCPTSGVLTLTANTAPNPCPVCGGGAVGGPYVTVQTQATWNSFIRYDLFSSATRTLTAQATARIQ
jgi:hypothetical protein